MAASTGTESNEPKAAAPPGWAFKVVNPVMGALLKTPLHRAVSGRLLLLRYTGRRSGAVYTLPVGYTQVGDTLFLGTKGKWARNLRDGVPVTVWLRGERRRGVADVVEDEAGLTEAYRQIFAKAPEFGRFVGVRAEADGEPNRDDVARARGEGHVVVEIRLT